jgi:hypothetical protein
MFVIEQRPRGFAGLIDELTADSVPPGDSRVVFGADVVRIDYGDCEGNGIELAARDGRTFRARKEVISTLPLGSMRHHHASIFSPALPEAQAALYSPRSRYAAEPINFVLDHWRQPS